MKLLLDTHTALWFWWNDPKLSKTARELIILPTNQKFVSLATPWEVAIKINLGKIDLGTPIDEYFPSQMSMNCFSWLRLTIKHFLAVSQMPLHHRDPFDRMLIAQSLSENMPIVSADTAFDAYPVLRLW